MIREDRQIVSVDSIFDPFKFSYESFDIWIELI